MEYELQEIDLQERSLTEAIDQDCIDDLEEARATYKELIREGMSNLTMANQIISETAHPRSIEVFANLLNTIAAVNGKLVDLQTTKKTLTKKEQKQEQLQGSVTNNLFVGSPRDLQEMLLSLKG